MGEGVENKGDDLKRNAALPLWAPARTQGATLTLPRPMQFSLKAGTRVASVDVQHASITRQLREEYNSSDNAETAERVALDLAREMYNRDHGPLPMKKVGIQTLVYHKKDSVTVEIFVQPEADTRKVTMKL